MDSEPRHINKWHLDCKYKACTVFYTHINIKRKKIYFTLCRFWGYIDCLSLRYIDCLSLRYIDCLSLRYIDCLSLRYIDCLSLRYIDYLSLRYIDYLSLRYIDYLSLRYIDYLSLQYIHCLSDFKAYKFCHFLTFGEKIVYCRFCIVAPLILHIHP